MDVLFIYPYGTRPITCGNKTTELWLNLFGTDKNEDTSEELFFHLIFYSGYFSVYGNIHPRW